MENYHTAAYTEARRRMLALDPREVDAWIKERGQELQAMVEDACSNHSGMLDSQRIAWTTLVLNTVPDWHTPACRAGQHEQCFSGRCTCNCEHPGRN